MIQGAVVISIGIIFIGFILISAVIISQNYAFLKQEHALIQTYTGNILHAMSDAVFGVDARQSIKFANGTALHMLHLDQNQITGQRFTDFFSDCQSIVSALEKKQKIENGEQTLHIKALNHSIFVSLSVSFVMSETGEIDTGVILVRDQTKQKQLEEQIRRQEKLTAMGGFASGVAHEIRNPLNAISMIVQRFQKEFEPTSPSPSQSKIFNQAGAEMNILIIDDEKSQRDSLAGFLKKRDYATATASSGSAGIAHVEKHQVDTVLTDFRMPDKSGLEVLETIKALNPTVDVVLMTAYGTIDTAVEAMKTGAFDYLTKPIDLDELELLLTKIQEHRYLVSENERLREQLAERYKLHNLIYQSRKMSEVASTVARIAPTRTTVLISGESGTGKEVLAKAIHYASPRKDRPMVAVNCAALSPTLLESELFGHEKGSFTGADRQHIGRFEQAHKSRLFLDEVGDIPLATQVKLLRVLQERTIERVGGNQPIKIDVRLIAATHRPLEQMIKEGTLREDLYFRLKVVDINIPPLREWRDGKTGTPLWRGNAGGDCRGGCGGQGDGTNAANIHGEAAVTA